MIFQRKYFQNSSGHHAKRTHIIASILCTSILQEPLTFEPELKQLSKFKITIARVISVIAFLSLLFTAKKTYNNTTSNLESLLHNSKQQHNSDNLELIGSTNSSSSGSSLNILDKKSN